MNQDDQAIDGEIVEGPKLLQHGRFAVYETPKGGMHLTMEIAGSAELMQIDVPAFIVKRMRKKLGDQPITPQQLIQGMGAE